MNVWSRCQSLTGKELIDMGTETHDMDEELVPKMMQVEDGWWMIYVTGLTTKKAAREACSI